MTARSFFLLGALVLCVSLLGFLLLAPDTVPMHFGLSGEADRTAPRGRAFLEIGLTSLGIFVVFALMVRWVSGRLPVSLMNLPHRDYWTAPEREPELRRMVAVDLNLLGGLTMMMLAALTVAIALVAGDGEPTLGPWAWVLLGLYLALVLGQMVNMMLFRYRPPSEGNR